MAKNKSKSSKRNSQHKSNRLRKRSGRGRSTTDYRELESRRMLSGTPGPDGDTNDQVCESVGGLLNGQTVTGAIGNGFGALDVDLFQISITSSQLDQEITFTVNTTDTDANPLDTYLRLFNDDGVELDNDEDGGPGNNSEINFTFSSTGTYFLGVSSSSNEDYSAVTGQGDETGRFSSTGSYELTFEDTNDQIDEASTTLLDGLSSGTINLPTDVDLFLWEGIDGQTIRFEVDGDAVSGGSGLDSFLRIFDDNGNELASDDDGGAGFLDSELTFTFDDTDDFYIGVSSFENTAYDVDDGTGDSTTATDTGSYTITATEVSLDPDDRLSNAIDLGNLFTDGTAVFSSTISDDVDVDLFEFTVGRSGSAVEIDVDVPTLGLDSLIVLFDANGTEIARNEDANAPGESGAFPRDSFLSRSLAEGTYFVGVSAFGNDDYDPISGLGDTDGNSTGSYTIEIQDRLHVDTSNDTNTGTFADNDDQNTLREAIAFANDTSGTQTITFQSSVFTTGETITLSVAGTNQLEITDSVVIEGLGAERVIISGNDNSRVFEIDNGNDSTEIDVTISGVTISDGNVVSVVTSENGAGIRNSENLALQNVSITSNTTESILDFSGSGGGLFHEIGTLTINNSTFSDNSSIIGGGIQIDSGTAVIFNSTLENNTATDDGGAIRSSSAAITLNASTVRGNTADDNGGGILSSGGTLNVVNGSTLENNTATDDGGAIFAQSGAAITIDDSTVRGNTAGDNGGGILSIGGTLNVVNGSTLENNTANNNGGAIFAQSGAAITIDASTVSGNTADVDGGGIILLDGTLNVVNGSTLADNMAIDDGGAIVAIRSEVTIDDSTVRGNTADDNGGGILSIGGTLNVVNGSALADNTANNNGDGSNGDGGGGAIFAQSGAAITIDDSTVSGNTADVNGGGIMLFDGTLNVVNGSTLADNMAIDDGGAIVAQSSEVTIDDSTVRGNTADDDGGGILSIGGTLNVVNGSTLENNTAIDDGGAIFAQSGAAVTIDDSTVRGNTADDNGGGILSIGGTLNVVNSTISNNTAGNTGGGIGGDIAAFGNGASGSTVDIDQSTIAFNTAAVGGGVQVGNTSAATVRNSIISDNVVTGSGTDVLGVVDANFSLIGDTAGATVSGANNLLDVDAQLGPLADNGGPTLTHALLQTSPAINAGDPAAMAGVGDTPQFDQRGQSRVQVGRLDIGAVESEFEGASLNVTITTDRVDATDGETSLREAIGFANSTSGNDTITFDASVFTGGENSLIRLNGTELEITDDLTIDASTAVGVTITGDADGDDVVDANFITDVTATAGAADDLLDDNSRVLNFSAVSGDLTLRGLTITGGRTTGSSDDGGGIRFGSGFDFTGTLTLDESTVSGNSTTGQFADGGGIYTSFGDVRLNNSTVSGNSASANGGGIYTSSGDVTLTNSTLSGNSADDGGGISTFTGDVTLTNSTLSGNSAGDDGGGIRTSSGDVTLNNSTLSGNQSGDDGGGIRTYFGAVTLTNSTLSGNEAAGTGGGVSVFNSSSNPNLTIENSILAGNLQDVTSPGVGNPNDLVPAPGSTLTINYSLIGVADNLGTITGNTGNLTGTVATPLAPLLAPLDDNGGPTQTHALLPGSPAINAGDPNAVAGQNDVPQFDQRGSGFDRVQGGRLDIGAFESSLGAVLLGDVNQDDAVDFLDIAPFIAVLSTITFQAEADVNQDGAVDFLDITPFIAILSSPSNLQFSGAGLLTVSADLPSQTSDGISVQLDETTSSPTLSLNNAALAQVSDSSSGDSSSKPIRETSDGVGVQLDATASSPTLLRNDIADAQLSVRVSEPSLLAYMGRNQFQNRSGSHNLRNKITVSNGDSAPMHLSRWQTDSFSERLKSSDAGSRVASSLDASAQTGIATRSAQLFDAHPEMLDELLDFDLESTTDWETLDALELAWS